MISIVIPIYQEQDNIQTVLDRIHGMEAIHLLQEIIWVQCEGEDYSVPTIIAPKRQRSTQLNAGALHAAGKILLFLHADTILPQNALSYIAEHQQGAFGVRFDDDSLGAQLIGFLTTLRAKVTKTPYGDQAFFMPKSVFDKVGGFDDVPILEDVLMAKKVSLPIAKHKVISSFRRYQKNGVIKTVLKHRYIMIKHLLGSSADELSKLRK